MGRGDSDDEMDRRPRDKFMMERGRNDFMDRRSGGGYGQREGGYNRSQGQFNRRNDMMDRRRNRNDFEANEGAGPRDDNERPPANMGGQGRYMMSFKHFLSTQDDSITDDTAVQKYQEYKVEYKRQQLHSFFVAHKEEEWFRLKYHPEESAKHLEEIKAVVQKRLDAFKRLQAKGWVNRCRLDNDSQRNVVKLLDGVVVLLEGGTDEDLEILDTMSDDFELGVEENADAGQNKSTRDDESGSVKDEKSDDDEPSAKKVKKEEGAWSDSDSESEDKPKTKRAASNGALEAGEVGDAKAKDKRSTQLHRTASIFLRNLAPAITRMEIEQLCKRFPGYLRVALAEPLPDRRFYRRGWVTFRRDVNIKDICWNLNNVRLRDCEMGAIINRDLTRKVRMVNGITAHRQVAQNDLRLAAKLIKVYDEKVGLFPAEGGDKPDEAKTEYGLDLNSHNPLLQNITDFLIEEASAEEEELLGTGGSEEGEKDEKMTLFERDENLLKALDRLILYLRVVHSVDYYNHGEYPNEDEMPNRCGLIHVRGPSPASPKEGDTKGLYVATNFVFDFMRGFEKKLENLLRGREKLSEEDAVQMGRKDPEKEVEAFVNANCQELAKDKWLCPLSGKKFKGPEFVRKHIVTKHQEKVDEVRAEVAYFNNYLYDPRRPAIPDTPPAPRQQGNMGGGGGYDRQRFQRGGAGGNDQDDGGEMMGGGGNYNRRPMGYFKPYGNRQGGFNRDGGGYGGGGGGGFRRDFGGQRYSPRGGGMDHGGRRGGDPRELITYRDLDAPSEDPF